LCTIKTANNATKIYKPLQQNSITITTMADKQVAQAASQSSQQVVPQLHFTEVNDNYSIDNGDKITTAPDNFDVTKSVQVISNTRINVGGFAFTRDKTTGKSVMYKCTRYQSSRCKMRIRYDIDSKTYYVKNATCHSHQQAPAGSYELLQENRRQELEEYVRTHLYEPMKIMVQNLNKNPSADPTIYITRKHIEQAKVKVRYSECVTSFQQLIFAPELSQTLDHQPFIRFVHIGEPANLIFASSTWQQNRLNAPQLTVELFFDGTFDAAPEGIAQVVTLMKRDAPGVRAEPVAFGWLWDKHQTSYEYFFHNIKSMAPNLLKCQYLLIHCDFERAMHNALRKKFEKPGVPYKLVIVGCFFHLKQAIWRWIGKHSNVNFKNNAEWLDDFWKDLDNLAKNRLSNWQEEQEKVLAKWAARDTEFAFYLQKTYFTPESLFPPSIWARSHFPQGIEISDQTNNEAESYHNSMNRCFKLRPSLKKGVQLLQLIEKHARDKKLFELQSLPVPISALDEDEENHQVEQEAPKPKAKVLRKRARPELTGTAITSVAKHNKKQKEAQNQQIPGASSFKLSERPIEPMPPTLQHISVPQYQAVPPQGGQTYTLPPQHLYMLPPPPPVHVVHPTPYAYSYAPSQNTQWHTMDSQYSQ